MKKNTIILLITLLAIQAVKCQTLSDKEIEDVRKFFIEKVLLTESPSGVRVIGAPMTEKQLIGNLTERNTVFLDKLIQYSHSRDSGYLYNLVREAPVFKDPVDYKSESFIYLDSTARSFKEIQDLQIKYNWPAYIQVGNFVFTNNNQTCLVFIHIFQGGGKTIELTKLKNNEWIVQGKNMEWLE